jgi:undecaprenyl-diphosphatase
MEWLESLVLGVVQGITEFLPVSSDGHLVITQQAFAWLTGQSRSAEEYLFFDIMLHVGTLAAILVHYRKVIWDGARGFLLGAQDVPPGHDRASVWRLGLLAIVATLPLIPLKLFFIDWIKETFKSGKAAGIGFLITAVVLLLVSLRLGRPGGKSGPGETSWLDALLIGLAQMFAPLPGVSRSGLTVGSALALGFSPVWAVGFSLLIAVPAISGAALSELKDALSGPLAASLTPDRIAQTVAATVVAGVVGYMAILWLIRVVRAGHLWYFSVYLIGLGLLVLMLASSAGGSRDARPATALDRTSGGSPAGPTAGGVGQHARGTLDRAHAAGARPGRARTDRAERRARSLERFLLARLVAAGAERGGGWPVLAGSSLDPRRLSRSDPPGPLAGRGRGDTECA